MKCLEKMKSMVRRLGGEGTFQRPEHLSSEISPAFAALLLKEAVAFGPPDAVLADAPTSECHNNSMKVTVRLRGELWSGFALNDAIWRVHSWVVKDGKVIEATPVWRERYVGISINSVERIDLCYRSGSGANGAVQ